MFTHVHVYMHIMSGHGIDRSLHVHTHTYTYKLKCMHLSRFLECWAWLGLSTGKQSPPLLTPEWAQASMTPTVPFS